jgi:hypothetical protein
MVERENPSPPGSQSRGPLSLVAGGVDDQRLKQRPPALSWDLSTSEDAYSGDHPGPPTSPLQLTPVLVESQIQRIADTAGALVKSLPVSDLEPKQPNAKKKICKELEVSKLIIFLCIRVVTCCEGLVIMCFLKSIKNADTPKVGAKILNFFCF